GDLDILFRIIKFGYTLKYEPNALVFHRHRNEFEKLKKQFIDHGTGFYSFIVRNFKAFPEERKQIIRLCIYHQVFWNAGRLIHSFIKPMRFPRKLILAEVSGCFTGLFAYQKAVKNLKEIENKFGKVDYKIDSTLVYNDAPVNERRLFAVRKINLNTALEQINDINKYQWVRIFVNRDNKLLGSFDYHNGYKNLNINQLKELLINNLWIKIVEHDSLKYWEAFSGLISNYRNLVTTKQIPVSLPKDIPVSIVIATLDRPEDLNACLESLTSKNFKRNVEIVIVDNNPSSGLTPKVLRNFPSVKLVNEISKGLSFARNAGIRAATGKIIITTDDDVVFADEWLENLLAPFARNDVAGVTGNTLPYELENNSQLLFERYGGLGKGFEPKEFDFHHFEWYKYIAFPTWDIGATSNAAFRAEIFHNPKIGMFDEALGTGTPTGCSEDTYLFYKIILNGQKIVYEPSAFVWHKHRKTLKALRKQIYNYSKGHVAYHLTTLFRDKDFRALTRIFGQLPYYHFKRIFNRLTGKGDYTLLLVFLEMLGNFVGPIAYFRSNSRVRKIKRKNSKVLIPDAQVISANKAETIS
ncbi:MAG TPA: glycosyltransferase, partial [Ignavibacteriaceae bacterium]|nr:glycosyltransferase [Ignavibacteriaceae bacterium]